MQFMEMVTDLLEGRLDVSTFEDNCRALLGEDTLCCAALGRLPAARLLPRAARHLFCARCSSTPQIGAWKMS